MTRGQHLRSVARLAGCTAALLVCCAAPPSAAAAAPGWVGPYVFANPGEAVSAPAAIRETAAGELVVAWQSSDGWFSTENTRSWLNAAILRRAGSTSWTPTARGELPARSSVALDIRIAGDGRVAALVPTADRVVAAVWSPFSGTWSDVATLTTLDTSLPTYARSGRAV